MEKLIDDCVTPKSCWNCQPEPCDQCDVVNEVFKRLKQYEDTGLTPEEIPHWISANERLPEEFEIEEDSYDPETYLITGKKKTKRSDIVMVAGIDKERKTQIMGSSFLINGEWTFYKKDRYTITHWSISLEYPKRDCEHCDKEGPKQNFKKENEILKKAFDLACYEAAKNSQYLPLCPTNRYSEGIQKLSQRFKANIIEKIREEKK